MVKRKKIRPMTINGHEYTLADVKIGIHSEETADFTATLVMDGCPIGVASNDGHGGCTCFYYNKTEKSRREALNAIEWALTKVVRFVFADYQMTYGGFGDVAEEVLYNNYSQKEIWGF